MPDLPGIMRGQDWKKPHRFLGAAFEGKILLVETELLVETADTATGVHHLLLTSVEGVTLGAHFDTDVFLSGAGLDHVAAGAPDGGLLIVGVEAFLHYIHLFLLLRIVS